VTPPVPVDQTLALVGAALWYPSRRIGSTGIGSCCISCGNGGSSNDENLPRASRCAIGSGNDMSDPTRTIPTASVSTHPPSVAVKLLTAKAPHGQRMATCRCRMRHMCRLSCCGCSRPDARRTSMLSYIRREPRRRRRADQTGRRPMICRHRVPIDRRTADSCLRDDVVAFCRCLREA